MPAFNTGRIQQVLAHVVGLAGQVPDAWGRELGSTHQSQGSHHHFGGILEAGKPGILEEIRVEQNP